MLCDVDDILYIIVSKLYSNCCINKIYIMVTCKIEGRGMLGVPFSRGYGSRISSHQR